MHQPYMFYLFRGTGLVCHQAGAQDLCVIKQVQYSKLRIGQYDYIREWLAEITSIPVGIAAFHHYHKDVINKLLDNSHNFNPNTTAEDEVKRKCFKSTLNHGLMFTLQALTTLEVPCFL